MTDRIALWLGVFLVTLIGLELLFKTGAGLFLLREFVDLIDFLEFWR